MKRIILFSAVACSMAFYSCSKDSKSDTNPGTDGTSTGIDPVALSAALKVGSATNVTGDIPAASADGPTLYIDGYENRTYYAVNNRYVVIYPQSDKGFVAGYYVKINGAPSYFKIEYKPVPPGRKSNSQTGLREEGDNSDSSILIKLPAGLTGDTFSIKYAAYDASNHVSNTITAIVSIVASKDTADNSLLYGTWRYNRFKVNYADWDAPRSYKIDTTLQSYSCVEGILQECSEGCENYPSRFYGNLSNDISFSANNTYTTAYSTINKGLNTEESTCSSLQYYDNSSNRTTVSGFSYNATTKILTIIYDSNGNGDDKNPSNLMTQHYTVTEISATRLVYTMKGEGNGGDDRTGARDSNMFINYYEYLKQ